MSVVTSYKLSHSQTLQGSTDNVSDAYGKGLLLNATAKAMRNADYLSMLDKSDRQLQEGRTVTKTWAELEAMAAE